MRIVFSPWAILGAYHGNKEEIAMNQTPNNSIKCSVTNCAHHCNGQNYCTLNEIKVGCCEPNATKCASTECASFQLGQH